MELVIDFCGYDATKHAVMHWHYSRSMPRGKLVRIGAWEDGRFIGAVVFARGAAPNLGRPYGLDQTQVCELVRVALDVHTTPTTQIVARAIALLREHSPGLQLIVSFADTAEGHVGTIYQAGNWIYCGDTRQRWFRVHGVLVHPKTLHTRYGEGGQSIPWLRAHVDPAATSEERPPKHRYLMPLNKTMRRRISPMALPFPRG